jgi:hypothetical protein
MMQNPSCRCAPQITPIVKLFRARAPIAKNPALQGKVITALLRAQSAILGKTENRMLYQALLPPMVCVHFQVNSPQTPQLVYTASIRKRRWHLLKIAIVVLLLALLVSMGSSFYFLMKDQGDKTKKRTLHSLGIRLLIAIALAGLIVYSIATGQLGNQNPWDAGPSPQTSHQP